MSIERIRFNRVHSSVTRLSDKFNQVVTDKAGLPCIARVTEIRTKNGLCHGKVRLHGMTYSVIKNLDSSYRWTML